MRLSDAVTTPEAPSQIVVKLPRSALGLDLQ